ncbi:MAG: helix-turn-helix domain-containing protein [Halioglobus sp.]
MTDSLQVELDIAVSPGALLRAERESQGMPERDAADRLNWMPEYVAVIESDSYDRLRNPAFARGYVNAYARLLGLDQNVLLAQFDRNRAENASQTESRKKERKPLNLQKTDLGVVVGMSVLVLMVVFMWWRSS